MTHPHPSEHAPGTDLGHAPAGDPRYPLTLYYESACPLCLSEMTNLMLRNQQGLLRFVDVSAADFQVPQGVTRTALLSLMHGYTANGHWLQGVAVFELAYLAAGLPQVSQLLASRWLRPLANRLYPVIARNRHRLPRWLPHLLFETALRRAALRAHAQRCEAGVCQWS
jgi:predicted DCC family thiol-disulfide oxidoreductase YuxK